MNLKLIIIAALLLLAGGVLFVFSQKDNSNQVKTTIPIQVLDRNGQDSQTKAVEKSFKVLSTTPANNQLNVYPGEIEISFTLDQDIPSDKAFSMEISPAPPFGVRYTNTFPGKTITAQVLGRLKDSTLYTVKIKNSSNQEVYSWRFTTSNETVEASSAQVAEYEKQLAKDYYPLSSFTPYISERFEVGYQARLELNAYIKDPDVQAVKNEITSWIKSKGVDPSTHKINYINEF